VKGVKKTGVFVDMPLDKILALAEAYGLEVIQLHGKELPEVCERLRLAGFEVIKAFSVNAENRLDTLPLAVYREVCDFFLFDTKGKLPGGNGQTFDWRMLEEYGQELPFFLSGGIGPQHAADIPAIRELGAYAIDVNSRFETEPGYKDIELLKQFTQQL
jgi:phosphoribosylanthranilate isomerase